MKLSPLILEKLYLCMASCHPMKNWDLPPPELITFKVTREKDAMATYRFDDELDRPHIITISRLRNDHFDTVQRSLAHEIVHMSFWRSGAWDKHGKMFRSRTRQIGKEYGWDALEL